MMSIKNDDDDDENNKNKNPSFDLTPSSQRASISAAVTNAMRASFQTFADQVSRQGYCIMY